MPVQISQSIIINQTRGMKEEKPVVRRFIGDKPGAAQSVDERDFGDPQLRRLIDDVNRMQAEAKESGVDLKKQQEIVCKLQAFQQFFFKQEELLSEEDVDEICQAFLLARKTCSQQELHRLPPFTVDMAENYFAQRNQRLLDVKRDAELDKQLQSVLEQLQKAKEKQRQLSIAEQERKGKIRVFCRIRPLNSKISTTRILFVSKEDQQVLQLQQPQQTTPNIYSVSKAKVAQGKQLQQPQYAPSTTPNLFPNSKAITSNNRTISNLNLNYKPQDKKLQQPQQTPINKTASSLYINSKANTTKNKSLTYKFDGIFNESTGQEQVFVQFEPVVSLAVLGKKVCIFSYGQTASGKTHTMLGSRSNPGLAYRALSKIFALIKEEEEQGWDCRVRMSADELTYTGKFDLVSKKKLQIKERSRIFIETEEDAFKFLQDTISSRTTSATNMNEASSRSHYILTVEIEQHRHNKVKNGTATIVDLAGSEKIRHSVHPDETIFINESLASLNSYLDYLHRNLIRNAHDTTLTIALSEQLKKETITLIVICVSPNLQNFAQSRRAAIFGTQARAVVKRR